MKVIRQPNELHPDGRSVSVAIGVFDGVHLGHQRILQQTVQDARQTDGVSVVVTFDQHPSVVVAPDRAPPLIYSLSQRLAAIDSLGIDTVLLLHFDRQFSLQSGEEFITQLATQFGRLSSLNIGRGFTFGYRRSGNVALLKALGPTLGFVVHDLPPVSYRGQAISSTRCRRAILDGDFRLASKMLGRPYSLAGPVVPGERLGHTLGFPTANLDVTGLALPPRGVYVGYAKTTRGRFRALMNIGVRPTLNRLQPELRVEVHLLDFSGHLYGHELEFEFIRGLRPEEKFESLDALRAQIQRDIEAARLAVPVG